MDEKTPLLTVDNLHAGYGQLTVLRDIHIDVYPSEIVALVGNNGAGKTTLLRTLSRLLPYTGSIHFNGEDINNLTSDKAFQRGLIQVPEGRQLFDRMTVADNLLMGSHLRRDKKAIAKDLEHMYTLFPRLGERRKQLAGSMSGGEQQMCAIARALMASPRMIMIDEMSLGLAPVIVQQLMEVLKDIREQGVTVLLVEQDVQIALSSADRGYVIETGEVALQGNAHELINNPAVQQAYLGI